MPLNMERHQLSNHSEQTQCSQWAAIQARIVYSWEIRHSGVIILYTGSEWELLIRWICFGNVIEYVWAGFIVTFCKQKEDFSVTLSAGYIVTPVGGNKWPSLLVSYLIIHSCNLFKNADSFRNKSSDYIYEWVIVFIHCLYKGVPD